MTVQNTFVDSRVMGLDHSFLQARSPSRVLASGGWGHFPHLSFTDVEKIVDILYRCRDTETMSKPSVELTAAEWSIMKAVWETEPSTAPSIQEQLFKARGWTYSTVRTLMDRMVAKRVLKAKKLGRVTLYSSAVTRREAQRCELLYALKHAFSGALTPMLQCLLDSSDLNPQELKELEALIQKKRRSNP